MLHIIETIPLDAINFECVRDKKGNEHYRADFKSTDAGRSVKALKSYFTKNILNYLQALFLADPALSDVSSPTYVDEPPSLTLSLSKEQYTFYCDNKHKFNVEKQHKLYYSCFHRYELPEDQCIYMLRIPDEDLLTKAVDVDDGLRYLMKQYPSFFSAYAQEHPVSTLNNQWGRFVIAHFIRTAEDYAKWLESLQAWYSKVKTVPFLDGLTLDFFSDDKIKQRQIAADQEFANDKFALHQLSTASEKLCSVYDFRWGETRNRYELVWTADEAGFSQFSSNLRRMLKDYNINIYLYATQEPHLCLYLESSNWLSYKRTVDAILIRNLTGQVSYTRRLPFSSHILANGKTVYIHVGNKPSTVRELNYHFRGLVAIGFKYDSYFCILLTREYYQQMIKMSWYNKPTKEECDTNKRELSAISSAADFFVPQFPDLQCYTQRCQKPDDLLEGLLALKLDSVEVYKLAPVISRFFRDKYPDREYSVEVVNKELCQLVNRHLENVTRAVSLDRYYESLQCAFKEVLSDKLNGFPFYVDYHRQRITYNINTELNGSILVFCKNGRYYCELKEIYKTKSGWEGKGTQRRLLSAQLFKLLIMVIHANAMIFAQQEKNGDKATPCITFDKKIFASHSSEQYLTIAENLHKNGHEIVLIDSVMDNTPVGKVAKQSAESYAKHVVIADTLGKDIGRNFFLLAGDEELIIPENTVLTYCGQGLVMPADVAKTLMSQGAIYPEDLIEFERHGMTIRGGRAIWRNKDWLGQLGAAQCINHTSDKRQVNVRFEFLDGPDGLSGGGVVAISTKEIRVKPHTLVCILASYGKDEQRLHNMHGIPIGSDPLIAENNIRIHQLTGIVCIDPVLEHAAKEFARKQQPKILRGLPARQPSALPLSSSSAVKSVPAAAECLPRPVKRIANETLVCDVIKDNSSLSKRLKVGGSADKKRQASEAVDVSGVAHIDKKDKIEEPAIEDTVSADIAASPLALKRSAEKEAGDDNNTHLDKRRKESVVNQVPVVVASLEASKPQEERTKLTLADYLKRRREQQATRSPDTLSVTANRYSLLNSSNHPVLAQKDHVSVVDEEQCSDISAPASPAYSC